MEMRSLLNLQGTMFLLVAVGVIMRKRGALPEQGKNILTDLVLGLVLPCNIINSFRMQFSLSVLKRFLVIILVACSIQVAVAYTHLGFNRKDPGGDRIREDRKSGCEKSASRI